MTSTADVPLIVLLGDEQIGKSDLLAKLLPAVPEHTLHGGVATFSSFDKGHSTLAWRFVVDLSKIGHAPRVLVDGEHGMRAMLLKRADCIVLAFALDSPASFASLEKYLVEVKLSKRAFQAPTILLGLRSDLPHAVSREEAEAFAAKYGLRFAAVSAQAGDLKELEELLEIAQVKGTPMSHTFPSASDMMVAGRNKEPSVPLGAKDFVWPASAPNASGSASTWWSNLVAKVWPSHQ
jgi:hypothetical protein